MINENIKNKRYKKFTKTWDINDYEIETDSGWVNIKYLHETIPYDVYHMVLEDGIELKCADNHIVMCPINGIDQVFVKDLYVGQKVVTRYGYKKVLSVKNLGYKEKMYDFQLSDESNHRYYTNDILSHNTELAKALSELMFDSPESLIRFDMSEYSEKFTISRLTGAPPGYVGYEDGGELTEKVKNKPYSVVLFDEIEKAHPDIYNILLQVLDEGHLTDSNGKKINFKNTILIFTSNIGIKEANDFSLKIGFNKGDKTTNKSDTIKKALKKQFPPEFLKRIDDIVVFNELSDDTILKIIDLLFTELKTRLSESGYRLLYDDSVINYVKNMDKDYEGTRDLQNTIRRDIENPISEELIKNDIPKNCTIKLTYDNKLIIELT